MHEQRRPLPGADYSRTFQGVFVAQGYLCPCALGLQRVLGLGSYQTAWIWLHKMRRAMVVPGRDRLTGTVEVDETFIGAPEEDVHGRETETKAIVVVAAEKRGKAIGRIRLQRIEDASAARLTAFLQRSNSEGSLLITELSITHK
jgi:hypothetical protein